VNASGRAYQLDLRVVAIGQGPALHGCKRRGPLAHFRDGLVHVRVGHPGGIHLYLQVLVRAQLNFRQDFEDGAKFQRPVLRVIHLVHVRLRDGR